MGLFWTCVQQQSVEIVTTCGAFSRVVGPGCNLYWPCIGECVAGGLNLRVQQLDVRVETKSSDDVFLLIVVSIQYQYDADNAYNAFYKLSNLREQLSAYVFDVVRSTVPKLPLNEVFTMKDQIAGAVKEELAKSMTGFGITIINTLVTDVSPDPTVRAAMNEIQAQSRLRSAAMERAEASKLTVIKAAEADAEAKYLAGAGIARQRQAIIAGLRESIKDFSSGVDGVSSRDVITLMITNQYLDAIQNMAQSSGANTIFLPHSPGSVSDLGAQIRDAFVQGSAVASAAVAPPGAQSMGR